MAGNLLVIHGGGPTAVLNASLWGVLTEAKKHAEISGVYGADGGVGGVLQGKLLNLSSIPDQSLALLPATPGTVLGTSRFPLEEEDYRSLRDALIRLDIRYVLMSGGNGTMDTCGKLCRACRDAGISVMGIPKTQDNDLACTDHAPGFASTARYMAQSVAEVCADVASLPIHVCVIEAAGRNAGWIAASSALAASSGFAPDLIYLPERPFDENEFLSDVQTLIDRKKGVVVVASEGLKGKDGKSIVPPLMTVGRATYFGDVSAHLAQLVLKNLHYKARSEKPGLLSRASIALQSAVDRDEAIMVGAEATRAVVSGQSGKMVAIRRVSTNPYRMETELVPVEQVMLTERTMPDEFITERGNYVTDDFISWCAPLIGEIPAFCKLR